MSKNKKFRESMNELTKFHYQNCREYKKILDLVYEYPCQVNEPSVNPLTVSPPCVCW